MENRLPRQFPRRTNVGLALLAGLFLAIPGLVPVLRGEEPALGVIAFVEGGEGTALRVRAWEMAAANAY
jgi:hypothetical protein